MQKLIEKHQKAIKILELIAECERRIADAKQPKVIYVQDYYKQRLIINTKIKTRLWQSYQNFMNGTLNV